ncbi:MAG TPA: HDOD domain-containing protein [Marinagarivorans sp.]
MKRELQQWVSALNGENLPGFAVTAKRLATLAEDDISAHAVADAVLPDAAMTVRILRLANSAYYNPGLRRIDTLNFACVVLGVKAVRNLAITAASLEAYSTMTFGAQFQREVAFSFHAAMQAQNLARLHGLQQEENIYIAALLARLGHWMFWCFPYGFGERLAGHLAGFEDSSAIESELLGFTLDELTVTLLKEWRLEAVLQLLPSGGVKSSEESQCVADAYHLARQLRKGWDHSGFQTATRRLMSFCRLPKADLLAAVAHCVDEVRKTLKHVKIERQYWPPLEHENPNEAVDAAVPLLQQALARDILVQKQSRLLRQLTHMLCQKVDVVRCLRAVVAGIHKGIACDNVFALMAHPKKQDWHITSHEGAQSQRIAQRLIRLMEKNEDSLVKELKAGRICWPPINPNIADKYAKVFDSEAFCIFPLRISGRHLGYIVAAKAAGKALSEEDFEVFCHFCDHAVVAIKLSLLEHGTHL